jgi:hypothetical protein
VAASARAGIKLPPPIANLQPFANQCWQRDLPVVGGFSINQRFPGFNPGFHADSD